MTNDHRSLPRKRARHHQAWVLAVVASAIILFAVVTWGIHAIVNARNRNATTRQFREVALSLTNYSDAFGHLPFPIRRESIAPPTEIGAPNGTGRVLHSWRVELVPFLMSWHGALDPSQPWNHQSNQQLVDFSSFYAYNAIGPKNHTHSFPETNVLALTGPGTAFGDGEHTPRALKDIPSDTVLVVETRASGIPWPAPGDIDIRIMPQTINAPDGKGISSRNAGGVHLMFADGQVWFLSDKVPFKTLSNFFTTTGAEKHDREKLLGPFVLHRGNWQAG